MSPASRWFYERIVPHLDDHSTRRVMVWMLAVVFAVVAGGPMVSRAAMDALMPKITLAETWGGTMVHNPVTLKATVEGQGLLNLTFQIYASETATVPLMDVQAAPSPAEPDAWLYTDFYGEPGAHYVVRAHGTWGPNAVIVEPKNTLAFTIAPRLP